jgi:hypothetical protein
VFREQRLDLRHARATVGSGTQLLSHLLRGGKLEFLDRIAHCVAADTETGAHQWSGFSARIRWLSREQSSTVQIIDARFGE